MTSTEASGTVSPGPSRATSVTNGPASVRKGIEANGREPTVDDLLHHLKLDTLDKPPSKSLGPSGSSWEKTKAVVRPASAAVSAFNGLPRNGVTALFPTAEGFEGFCKRLGQKINDLRGLKTGEVASYIPQLAKASPDTFAVAICTVHGDEVQFGDHREHFSFQSCVKPFTYLLALDEHGPDHVHSFVGMEPSGTAFNAFTLNAQRLPHNPMINAGAIVCCSLIRKNDNRADRFGHLQQKCQQFAGGLPVTFNYSMYSSEKETGYRNYALAYFMQSENVFKNPRMPLTEIQETLDFYFQACSLEVDVRTVARMGATLANGGVDPFTQQQVAEHKHVKNVIKVMFSCGMYDFSGEWACSVGVPAKSGVSGIVMLVVPNVMSVAIYSPPLDAKGNSVRGIELSRWIASELNISVFDRSVGL